jgi:hypothetical protein
MRTSLGFGSTLVGLLLVTTLGACGTHDRPPVDGSVQDGTASGPPPDLARSDLGSSPDGAPIDGSTNDGATALTVATTGLPDGTVGSMYAAQLVATGGTAPYSWTILTGSFPSGVSLATSGLLSGKPTAAGSASVMVQVTDAVTSTASATVSLTIDANALAIVTTSPLQQAVVGTAYSGGFDGSGGVLPYAWTISVGSLPDGLSLDGPTGAISGTATTAGTSTFTVELTDAAASTASLAFSLTVDAAGTLLVPTNFRVDVEVGTTGELFVSWDGVSAATYYNLQRSTALGSGYALVSACSGATLGHDNTKTGLKICRDGGLTVGTSYYYEVQACNTSGCSLFSAPASNSPVTSDCTATQIPPFDGLKAPKDFSVVSTTVDDTITFDTDDLEFAAFPPSNVTRRHQLYIALPGSGEFAGIGFLAQAAQFLGYDVISINYSNLSSQENVCVGDPLCFEAISEAKFDWTGPCTVPNTPPSAHCGTDPHTHAPYYNGNPADAITQRVSKMLQYLNANQNVNGTNWGEYLSGTTPIWSKIALGGHSQGGDMATFTAYKQSVARAVNISGPPQATPCTTALYADCPMDGVEVGAPYLNGFITGQSATELRRIYGLVSVNDARYIQGVYFAVWSAIGFDAAHDDVEEKLDLPGATVGIDCNAGTPSHNFSSSAPTARGTGHDDTLYPWFEDVYKFMLTQ